MPAFLPSELPILGRVRHHWIVLLRLPHPVLGIALLVLLVMAWAQPYPTVIVLALLLGGNLLLRWQTWRAESVILTRTRIIRVRGVPETTSSESSLRLSGISGLVLEQTVLGKLLDYGSIEIEAPGQHPDVRQLTKIARPHPFYLQIRRVIYGKEADFDPTNRPADFITAPLPRLPDPRRPPRP
jgi:hypothetical protein